MAKSKANSPTSIRLSPNSTKFVEQIQKATGWSVSKVLEHMVLLCMHVQTENAAAVKLIRAHIRQATESRQKMMQADAIAAQARAAVRRTAAAVKGAK